MYEKIDELGAVKKAIAELELIASKLSAEIKAKGIGTYVGAQYMAEVTEYDRENISAPLVRKFADPELLDKCTVIQHVTAVTVAPMKAN